MEKQEVLFPNIKSTKESILFLDEILVPLYDSILINDEEKIVKIVFPTNKNDFDEYYVEYVFKLLSIKYSIGSVLSVTEIDAIPEIKQEFDEIIEEIQYDEEDFEDFIEEEIEMLKRESE